MKTKFLIMMTFGAAVSLADYHVNSAETAISASIFMLGLTLLLDRYVQKGRALALVTVSALGHGYVHAEEIEAGIDTASYILGFLSTTALLLGLGAAIGFLPPFGLKSAKKTYGLVYAAVGLTLLIGI